MRTLPSKHSRPALLPHWNAALYSAVSRVYDTVTSFTGWRRQLAKAALEDLPHGRLLDVGCGTGYILNLARRLGFEVRGADPSGGMLAKAVKQYGFPPGTLVQAPAETLPFEDESFDVVLATGVLVHLPNPEKAVTEMARVARKGGLIRIIDHDQPRRKNLATPLAFLFLQLSGDILHDYAYYFKKFAKLKSHKTLGRGGYLQRFDFVRVR